MADYNNMLMNPWVLHLQKLELELKCPLCLKLLNRPVLLPCDHVFFHVFIKRRNLNQAAVLFANQDILKSKPKLFDGLKFYFFGDFVKGYKEDLQNLVKVAGGTILNTEDELDAGSSNNFVNDQTSSIVVYNIDPPIGYALGEEVTIIWQRANDAEALSSQIGSRLVGHTWLLESIAGYKLHHVVNTLGEREKHTF